MMDKNDRRKHSDKRQPREYVYLLQGLLRCGRCGHKMSPKPGKGRSGEYYHYNQMKALALFNEIVKANEDKPDRIKAIIPRFLDYVILHEDEEGRGSTRSGALRRAGGAGARG
jgi:hypothetical protein